MAEDDYNIIKPVESLQNVGALSPAKRREERKKRQNLNEQSEQEPEKSEDQKDIDKELAENEGDQHSIDYCA